MSDNVSTNRQAAMRMQFYAIEIARLVPLQTYLIRFLIAVGTVLA